MENKYLARMNRVIDEVKSLIEEGLPADLKWELNKSLSNLRNLAEASSDNCPEKKGSMWKKACELRKEFPSVEKLYTTQEVVELIGRYDTDIISHINEALSRASR